MADTLQELRELIRENRFAEARKILKTLNHPKKAEWLAKLDEREVAFYNALPTVQSTKSTGSFAATTTKEVPQAESPKTDNLFAAIFRVFIGGLVGILIVPIVLILADTQLFHFSEFLMNERSRHVAMSTFAFLGAGSFLFVLIARGIAKVADIFAGIYYALLMGVVIFVWHYGSFYVGFGMEQGLTHALSPDSFSAYSLYLVAPPGENLVLSLVGALGAMAGAYILGSLSTKELLRD